MTSRPLIYISAVGEELRHVQLELARWLIRLGFEPEIGSHRVRVDDLLPYIRYQIEKCDAVVQLVGQHYGLALRDADPEFGPVSYTQYEALYARKIGKPVNCFLLSDTFLVGTVEPQSPQHESLQRSYREHLQRDNLNCATVTNMDSLRDHMVALPDPERDLWRKFNTVSARAATNQVLCAARRVRPEKETSGLIDKGVQFTVYRPQAMQPGAWAMWLAFVHHGKAQPGQPSPLEQVQEQAETMLGEKLRRYNMEEADSRVALPRESAVTIVPEVEGVEFDPPRRVLEWQGETLRAEFLGRTGATTGAVEGRVTFFLGCLIIGVVSVRLRIGAPALGSRSASITPHGVAGPVGHEPQTSDGFRKIFPSYSRKDKDIVEHMERLVPAFGDKFLRDVNTLRAGEEWQPGLAALIEEATVFQLFWSRNAMASEVVRKEYEHALGLGRKYFVRPVYWENPFPRNAAAGLPPAPLAKLHFYFLPILEAKPPGDAPAGDGEMHRSMLRFDIVKPLEDIPPDLRTSVLRPPNFDEAIGETEGLPTKSVRLPSDNRTPRRTESAARWGKIVACIVIVLIAFKLGMIVANFFHSDGANRDVVKSPMIKQDDKAPQKNEETNTVHIGSPSGGDGSKPQNPDVIHFK